MRYLFLIIIAQFNGTITSGQLQLEECSICQRLTIFSQLTQKIGTTYWPGFGEKEFDVPLVYFSDSNSYLAFDTPDEIRDSAARKIICPGIKLYKLSKRLDSIPFHMENKIDIHDPTTPYYFKPFMFCSDVEAMVKTVKDFKTTEEWLQLVLHEYFHSFQFSNKQLLDYFSNEVSIKEDSLTRIYQTHEWFSARLKDENYLLLQAINTANADSTTFYIREFIRTREKRRAKFIVLEGYDISKNENFWEKIEGAARYIEYNAAFVYSSETTVNLASFNCDKLFNRFMEYGDKKSLINKQSFKARSQIMPAYYYVTGFNMCRLLDKLKRNYKRSLFSEPRLSLLSYLIAASK